jgi:hypothetical protein
MVAKRVGRAAYAAGESVIRSAAGHDRLRLSSRLRRILTENPGVQHFTVQKIVNSLGPDHVAPSVALFAAAGVFEAPDVSRLSGAVMGGLGAALAFGRREIRLPRALLRRKIPRSSLSLLIHSVSAAVESAEGRVRERWSWVFHPLMSGVLGLVLFLLGLASMAPIIGGGVQHAASAFLVALGMAERDGLTAMIGALAGVASLALAAISVASGRKLWAKLKAWLMKCARILHLDALAALLDYCCDGLGELVRMRWSGLLVLMLTPGSAIPRRSRHPAGARLRDRVRRARMAAAIDS